MSFADLDLNSLPIFAAVVQAGSFTAAAERLGCTKTKVSLHVRELEKRLGTTLLTRTTRQVRLTEAGEQFYRDCQPLLAGLQQAVSRVESEDGQLGGLLRIAAPMDYAAQVLAPLVAEFGRRHPDLQIELCASDRISDMLRDGIHLSIRMGWLRDSSLRASRLGSFRQYLVGAPEYLARVGRPQSPEALAAHRWVEFGPLPSPLTWTFSSGDGRQRTVQMHGSLRTDSTASLRSLLCAGAGLSVLPDYAVAAELANGQLERLLPDWQLPDGGLHAVYPPGEHLPARARAFVDFYRGHLQHTDN